MNVTALRNYKSQAIITNKDTGKDSFEIRVLFDAFMNSSIFAISIIDKNHKIIRVNPLFAEFFNKPVDSFVGKYCFKESEKRDHICSHCPGVRAMVSGETEEAETRGIRDDGSIFDARICAIPFYDTNNKIAGFIEMVENTTKKKQYEVRLRESEEKYRTQFEGAMDAIFIADTETGILMDCNKAAIKLFGRKKEEIVDQHQRILHPPYNSNRKFTPEFEEHIKCKEGKVLETKVITKSGEIRDVEIKANTLEVNGKKIIQGTFRDITEKKQKEIELKKMQEELIVASRQAGMSEVAEDVLHNVGNVLNNINVITTLVKDTLSNSEIPNLKKVTDMIEGHLDNMDYFFKDDPKGKHIPPYLKEVATLLAYEREETINKLKMLINDINHVKNIISTQQKYTKASGVEVTITIDEIIENAICINETSLKHNNIHIIKQCTDMGKLHIDKFRVGQILINLIDNAKNALVESNVADKVLTIRTYKPDDKHLQIEVTDNGIGISPENLTKIFQHGFTTRKDGHGFGLHSNALSAKDMNGSLSVYSEGTGHGATFILQLPFKAAGECNIEKKSIINS